MIRTTVVLIMEIPTFTANVIKTVLGVKSMQDSGNICFMSTRQPRLGTNVLKYIPNGVIWDTIQNVSIMLLGMHS